MCLYLSISLSRNLKIFKNTKLSHKFHYSHSFRSPTRINCLLGNCFADTKEKPLPLLSWQQLPIHSPISMQHTTQWHFFCFLASFFGSPVISVWLRFLTFRYRFVFGVDTWPPRSAGRKGFPGLPGNLIERLDCGESRLGLGWTGS